MSSRDTEERRDAEDTFRDDDDDDVLAMSSSADGENDLEQQKDSCDSTVALSLDASTASPDEEAAAKRANADSQCTSADAQDGLKKKQSSSHVRSALRLPPYVCRMIFTSSQSCCIVKTLLLYLCVFVILLLFVLICGMGHEQLQMNKIGSTSHYFVTSHVCAATTTKDAQSNTTTELSFQSLENASLVEALPSLSSNDTTTSSFVAHCGDCGQCSNPHDIKIYDDTKNTLFKHSLQCGKQGVFGGYGGAAKQCMNERVGMTDGCTDCWVENMLCDARNCIFSCTFHLLFGGGSIHKGSKTERLNRCTKCDELRCGPQFVTCAGANRRRTGIVSDISRDGKEVCPSVAHGWWRDEDLLQLWNSEYGETDSKSLPAEEPTRSRPENLRKGLR